MPAGDPRTAREIILWAEARFRDAGLCYGHGTDNPRDDAVFIVFSALNLPYDCSDAAIDRPLGEEERGRVIASIDERIRTRSPAAYIMKEAWFAGLRFYVDERVLVPRSPIAELVEAGFEPWVREADVHRIADLCTGSGCIAIACALAFPAAEVHAIDISADALDVAARNVDLHGVGSRVRLFRSDLFEQVEPGRYELIVSNPPYVPAGEIGELPAEYQHEPVLGLAAGSDGLEVVDRLLVQAAERLTDEGVLICEVGDSEHALAERYPHVPFLWLELERGGGGVFLLEARDLRAHFGDGRR